MGEPKGHLTTVRPWSTWKRVLPCALWQKSEAREARLYYPEN